MKIENTSEAKARFFALYYGQIGIVSRQGFVNRDNFEIKHIDDLDQIELAPLSQIIWEDAMAVAQLDSDLYLDINILSVTGNVIIFTCRYRSSARRYKKYTGLRTPSYKQADFLRSRGYYVGDGSEIEYGWVTLKGATPCK